MPNNILSFHCEKELPWNNKEKSKNQNEKYKTYYEVILGTIDINKSMEKLCELYKDDTHEKISEKGDYPIATITVDSNGYIVSGEKNLYISSFSWGLPVALNGDLNLLSEWPHKRDEIAKKIKKSIFKSNTKLTINCIDNAFEILVDEFDLTNDYVLKPCFAIKKSVKADSQSPLSNYLNSFFVDDLIIAKNLEISGNTTSALNSYLGIKEKYKKHNLLDDDDALQKLLNPSITPLGSWPGKGRLPLSVLQQAVINSTHKSQMDDVNVLSVNGPPGTGKTTLLRDIISARIVERSIVMSEYENPSTAFEETFVNGSSIYKLDDCLKGFEIIVASSNNKSVENISAELPSIYSISEDETELKYFKSMSDNYHKKDTWGSICAILGKDNNIKNFNENFLSDYDNGFLPYLDSIKNPKKTSNKSSFKIENPPSGFSEAKTNWKEARRKFKETLKKSKDIQSQLKEIHEYLIQQSINLKEEKKLNEYTNYMNNKNIFINFYKFVVKNYKKKILLESTVNFIKNISKNFPKLLTKLIFGIIPKRILIKYINSKKSKLNVKLKLINEKINLKKSKLNFQIPDSDFFSMDRDDIYLSNVWFNDESRKIHHELFKRSMEIHKAFIDCSSAALHANLSMFKDSFKTLLNCSEDERVLISDVWSSLSFIAPVISTTFSSVSKMLSITPNETFGWLLIDEAGQSKPQEAVGAIMKSKKVLVVGDPMQTEPIVSIANKLSRNICEYSGVDPKKYNSPTASVQTLADSCSKYFSKFKTETGERYSGSPLLIHRRCNNPMFDISNEIAYSNLMTKGNSQVPENTVLGSSSWIDVVGTSDDDKYCEEEFQMLIKMMKQIKDSGLDPSIYIITPFKNLAKNIKSKIKKTNLLNNWVKDPNTWIKENIGTIHIFQGGEAEIVFFVLGAQNKSHYGARHWAGKTPNLVNVAVTRAKTSLYVIGNRDIWKSNGVFSVLDSFL